MYLFISKILEKIGVDGAVAYTVVGRLWQSGASLISLFIIAHFLSSAEQGYYFTFASIIALQIFIELGLSVVITQFASHERAHLKWESSEILVGPKQYKDRLASLLQLIIRWYGVAGILIITLLLPAGYLFFLRQQAEYSDIVWQAPWFCLVLFFSIFFYLSPLLNFLEGCGKIKEVARMRIAQDLVANLLLWVGCFGGVGLWVAPLFCVGKSLVILWWISTDWRKRFFVDMLKIKPQAIISWRKEIFPFQWKIALSWMSGFFIFQLFNPVLFAYHGAVVAGQMGLSLAACGGIAAIAMAWVNTKIPIFGNLIAKKEYMELDNLFFRVLKQSFFVMMFLMSFFMAVIYCLKFMKFPLGDRFLPIFPFLLLGSVVLINHLIFSQAVYLRAHKKEPLLVNSVAMGGLMCLSTYFLGKYYSAIGVVSGYFILTCFSLIFVTVVFLKKRKIWHR